MTIKLVYGGQCKQYFVPNQLNFASQNVQIFYTNVTLTTQLLFNLGAVIRIHGNVKIFEINVCTPKIQERAEKCIRTRTVYNCECRDNAYLYEYIVFSSVIRNIINQNAI